MHATLVEDGSMLAAGSVTGGSLAHETPFGDGHSTVDRRDHAADWSSMDPGLDLAVTSDHLEVGISLAGTGVGTGVVVARSLADK